MLPTHVRSLLPAMHCCDRAQQCKNRLTLSFKIDLIQAQAEKWAHSRILATPDLRAKWKRRPRAHSCWIGSYYSAFTKTTYIFKPHLLLEMFKGGCSVVTCCGNLFTNVFSKWRSRGTLLQSRYLPHAPGRGLLYIEIAGLQHCNNFCTDGDHDLSSAMQFLLIFIQVTQMGFIGDFKSINSK